MQLINRPSKLDIANSFSKAAVSYDQSAELQRNIGRNLLSKLPDTFKVSSILDLGCGTGYFTQQLGKKFPQAALVGLDLAEGMLKQAQQSIEINSWIAGDAEQLPIKDNSVDFVFSNLALQWCHDFSAVLDEVYRVLTPKGIFLFTSLCNGTLSELKQSWQAVDSYIHVNSFINYQHYQQLIHDSKFIIDNSECIAEISYYPNLKILMSDLKGIGAHNINPQRHKGLTSRQQLNTLVSTYESFRTTRGLPATYQVIYSSLKKG